MSANHTKHREFEVDRGNYYLNFDNIDGAEYVDDEQNIGKESLKNQDERQQMHDNGDLHNAFL